MRRLVTAGMLVLMWSVATTTFAAADPPGPTDYMNDVTEVSPDVAGFAVEIIGGDSFVLLTVDPGVTVEVVGYQGEPYLRFLEDGIVEENQHSPSTYLNEERFAAVDLPAEADVDAAPDWKVVGTDGSYAWHDHRTHWMNPEPPPGRAPGDQIVEGVVPLVVDGVEVGVTVVSVWQQPPSSVPVALGFTLGLLIAFGLLRRRDSVLAPSLLVLGLAATLVGAVAYLSVPTETSPPWSLWVFPVTGVLVALVVLALGNRGGMVERQRQTLLLVAAVELVGWGISHWGWLWPSILPTSLPFWVDRFVASTVLVSAIGAAAAVIAATAAPSLSTGLLGAPTGPLRGPAPQRPSRRRFRR